MIKAIVWDLNGVVIKNRKLDTGLLEIIKKTKQKGIKSFILSNSTREISEWYQKTYNDLFEGVDKVYFSWETGYIKPEEEAWEWILKNENLKAEECVYIDDSEINIEAAKRIGFGTCLYKNEAMIEEFFKKNGL